MVKAGDHDGIEAIDGLCAIVVFSDETAISTGVEWNALNLTAAHCAPPITPRRTTHAVRRKNSFTQQLDPLPYIHHNATSVHAIESIK